MTRPDLNSRSPRVSQEDLPEDVLPLATPSPDSRPLMTAKELDPRSIQGDRFDAADDDVSYQPDLEQDPDSPADIFPDQIRAMPGELPDNSEENPDISARPRDPHDHHP